MPISLCLCTSGASRCRQRRLESGISRPGSFACWRISLRAFCGGRRAADEARPGLGSYFFGVYGPTSGQLAGFRQRFTGIQIEEKPGIVVSSA